MENTIFAQSVARIKVLETKMIDRAKLESLIEAKDFDEAIRILQDSVYGEYVSSNNYEEGLKASLEDFYKEMFKICPVSSVVDLFRVKYDVHNLKTFIKAKLLKKELDNILIDAGSIELLKLKEMLKNETYSDLPNVFKEAVIKAIDEYNNNKNPQVIDIILDSAMFNRQLELAKESNIKYLEDYLMLQIDILNIKTFIRAKEQKREKDFIKQALIKGGKLDIDVFLNNYVEDVENFANKIFHTDHFRWLREGIEEYLKTNDLGRVEKAADNYTISILKNSKFVSFGAEPIVAYMFAKENEIKLIRIILTGKKNKVAPDIIRERLRDIYV